MAAEPSPNAVFMVPVSATKYPYLQIEINFLAANRTKGALL